MEKCRLELEDDICVTAIFLERVCSLLRSLLLFSLFSYLHLEEGGLNFFIYNFTTLTRKFELPVPKLIQDLKVLYKAIPLKRTPLIIAM